MPVLTERERAKRAKMVARFNAFKHQAHTSDACAGPSVASSTTVEEKFAEESSKLDSHLVSAAKVSEKQQQPAAVQKPEAVKNRASAINCEEKPSETELQPKPAPSKGEPLTVVPPKESSKTPAEHEEKPPEPVNKKEPTAAPSPPEPAPPALPAKTEPTNNAAAKDLTVKIPSTPIKSNPRSQSTPRSRARSTSIADAKKKLAAARMVSSSPAHASRDKAVIGEIVSMMEDEEKNERGKEEKRESYENKLRQKLERVDIPSDEECEEQAAVEDQDTVIESKGSSAIPSSPLGMTRSQKISKIRARSPRFADRHRGLLSSLAPAEDETKQRLSDGFGNVVEVQSKERWSDEFSQHLRHEDGNVGASRLSDEYTSRRLSYGSAMSHGTYDGSLNALKPNMGWNAPRLSDGSNENAPNLHIAPRLSAASNARTISDELNASRLSDECGAQRLSAGTVKTAATLESSTESARPGGDKTWQEKAKIAAKARQHRKWQHNSTPLKAAQDKMQEVKGYSSTKTKTEQSRDLQVTSTTSKDSYDETQEVNAYTSIKARAQKFRDSQVQGKNAPIGSQRRSLDSDASERSEREPAAKRDELQHTNSMDTHETEEPGSPLSPSRMVELHEKGTFHMKMIAAKNSPSPSKKPDLMGYFTKESTAKTRHSSSSQPSLSKSVSEYSSIKPRTGKSANSASHGSTFSEYKTLVPSRSGASKHSEPSLAQLTISTSDVTSFVPIEEAGESFSPKLAGEEFLSGSRETDGQQRSNEFEDDDFQSNFDWPMDAFSPTSWPGGQASPSDDSKWENAVPDTPNLLAVTHSLKDKEGWNLNAKAPTVVEWGDQEEDQHTKTPKKAMAEWDSWGQTGFYDEQFVVEQRDDEVTEEARAEAEARITELEEQGGEFHIGDETSCSVQYEGFSTVEHGDCPSRRGSPRQEYQASSPDVMSKCSEGTMGSATEFDPISMFEASVSDSFADGISKKDSFPACDAEENDGSAASWGSAKVLKGNDDSTNLNSAFPSLRSGAAIEASTLFSESKPPIDTPSGNESLGSWWQNRYASTQSHIINAAVQEALRNDHPSHEEQRSDNPTERCSSPPCRESDFENPKKSRQQRDAVLNDPLSTTTKCFRKHAPPSFNGGEEEDDDDSIFGDLDDESVGCPKHHTTTRNKNRHKSSLSKIGTIVSHAETEDDIFAGVSVSSRKVTRPKEAKNANRMMSLLDLSTTTGSHSLLQKTTKTNSKEPGCPPPKLQEEKKKPMGLFMMDGTYGIIDVKHSGERSPSGASVTSDITTSVIFPHGGDFGKKRQPPRKGSTLSSSERGVPEAIVEVNDVLSNELSVCSPTKKNANANAQDFDNEDTENVDPQGGCRGANLQQAKDFLKDESGMDEATQQNKPSLWKKALSMARNGGNYIEEKAAASKTKCTTFSSPLQETKCAFNNPLQESKCAFNGKLPESVGGVKPAAAAAAVLLLPFAPCAIIGASAYAFCATKDHLNPADTRTMSQVINEDGIVVVADAADAANLADHNTNDDAEEETIEEIDIKESYTGTLELETVESNQEAGSGLDVTKAASGSEEESRTLLSITKSSSRLNLEAVSKSYETAENDEAGETDDDNFEDNSDGKSTMSGEDLTTLADEQTLNTNGQTVSTYDRTISTCDEDDTLSVETDDDDDDYDEDDGSDFTEPEFEGTEVAELVSLSELEQRKWKDWESKDSAHILSPRSKKSLQEEQSRAYEKLLFYAYTALTVPPPSEIVEKGELPNSANISYPPVLSPRGAELRCEAMKQLLKRLGEEGMEVLKLNREKKWQPRFLTITKEVVWFKKSDDIRYNKIDCCPQGLLWVKKFNGHSKEHSVASVGKQGKGGIVFTGIKAVSVTTDNFGLSKKQRKGKFKDSFTFVLHADFEGRKRDILFRCCNKEDICTLSAGFQAIIDRIKNERMVIPKPLISQHEKLPITAEQVISPVAVAKPFSPKATESDDRWEV